MPSSSKSQRTGRGARCPFRTGAGQTVSIGGLWANTACDEPRDARTDSGRRRRGRLPQPVRVQRRRPGSGAGGGGARSALRGGRGARDQPVRRLRPRHGGRRDVRQRRPRERDDRLAAALPERGRPLRAPDRGGGGRAREEDRGRRRRGQEPHDQLESPPGRLDREEVPGPRPVAAGPDPGRRDRPDPRSREVRLAARLQVLDLRDVVDPAGGPARRREQVAHDPDPRPHRRPRAEDRPRRARADRQARPRPDGRGDLQGVEDLAQAPARGTRGCPCGDEPRQAARRRQRRRRWATSSASRRAESRRRSRSA